jgi:hypothetical protein
MMWWMRWVAEKANQENTVKGNPSERFSSTLVLLQRHQAVPDPTPPVERRYTAREERDQATVN